MTDTREKRHDGVRTIADIRDRCRVDADTDCWLWAGAVSPSGGGARKATTRVGLPRDVLPEQVGRTTTASRAAWLLDGRPLPAGHVVWRHYCDSPTCVNPAHCLAGTKGQQNAAAARSGRNRGIAARRIVNTRNAAKHATPVETVRLAEAWFAAGMLQKHVKAQLKLANATVQKIKYGTHTFSSGKTHLVRGASVFSYAQGAAA